MVACTCVCECAGVGVAMWVSVGMRVLCVYWFSWHSTMVYVFIITLAASYNSPLDKVLPKDVGVGGIWEELLTTSKLLCSTYLKIKEICWMKFKGLKYTGENAA